MSARRDAIADGIRRETRRQRGITWDAPWDTLPDRDRAKWRRIAAAGAAAAREYDRTAMVPLTRPEETP